MAKMSYEEYEEIEAKAQSEKFYTIEEVITANLAKLFFVVMIICLAVGAIMSETPYEHKSALKGAGISFLLAVIFFILFWRARNAADEEAGTFIETYDKD
jgi:hypothetical protein